MHKTSSLKKKPLVDKSKPISILSQKLYESIHTLDVNEGSMLNETASNFNRSQKMGNSGILMGQTFSSFNKNKYLKDEDVVIVSNLQDPLSKLLSKAKEITSQNQSKIEKAKKQLKQQKQKFETFLTGTGLYEAELETPLRMEQYQNDVDPNDLLKQLLEKQQNDDLAELRRMIKVTNKNLNGYEKQIYESSQGVMSAADQFQKQMDTGLRYKMNRMRAPQEQVKGSSSRKAYSVNRIKDPKYL